jgi:hypothetical protein
MNNEAIGAMKTQTPNQFAGNADDWLGLTRMTTSYWPTATGFKTKSREEQVILELDSLKRSTR